MRRLLHVKIFSRKKIRRSLGEALPEAVLLGALPPLQGCLNVEAELDVSLSQIDRLMRLLGEQPPSVQWWTTSYGKWRLTVETEAMRRFPAFEPALLEDSRLCWLGQLESSLSDGERYLVRVVYPSRYPCDVPEVTIVKPKLPDGTPHLLNGQHPCLYRPGSAGFDPGTSTAATLVAWTALWIHAFGTWRATGRWPGKGE